MKSAAASQSLHGDVDRWIDEFSDTLFRFALTRLRRRQDAEDVVQETLLAAWNSRGSFRGDSSELTWLIAILRNKIVDRIRLVARDDAVMSISKPQDTSDGSDFWSKAGKWLKTPKSWSVEPNQALENKDFWQQVRKCFSALSDRQAQAFALRTFDDFESEEICKQLNISESNLGVLLHRARSTLRNCLEASWFTADERR